MRQKLILHVGPTNSGKIFTALQTLSASRVGAYGGPHRLLAHEKNYERLNTGQIVPLGVEAADNYEVDEDSNLDVQVPGTPAPFSNTEVHSSCNHAVCSQGTNYEM
jgi:hypothetical protein